MTDAVDPRTWLAARTDADGNPLAKAGARGRFSAAAVAALDEARAQGVVFATAKPAKAKNVDPVPSLKAEGINGKAVRAWAAAHNVKVGDRGRIPADIVQAYRASEGFTARPVVQQTARPTPAMMPKVRRATTGFVIAPRPAGAPSHVSTPLVRMTSCAKCKNGVSQCPCATGPVAPSYLGGQVMILDKPAV